MSYALIFSGQANQHPDMLPWLESEPACAPTLQLMGQHLGPNWRLALQDAERRSDNAFAQVLITGTALAAWDALSAHLETPPAVVAGYSVGELPAFACAGVFSPQQALQLASQRARLMDQAVAGIDTGLLAVSGLSEAEVRAACQGLPLALAIQIDTRQSVYAATAQNLDRAQPLLTARGAICTRLAVRVASHSPWMQPAARAFAEILRGLPFAAPRCPLAVNASGALARQAAPLRLALGDQLDNTLQWGACMDAIAERQVACVLEIGAGSALSSMWNVRYPNCPARSIDAFQNVKGAAIWLGKHLAT